MMSKFERVEGPINGIPNRDGLKVAVDGVCAGVVVRSDGFFFRHAIYFGFLVLNDEMIFFKGVGSIGCTDGDLETSLAKLSADLRLKLLFRAFCTRQVMLIIPILSTA